MLASRTLSWKFAEPTTTVPLGALDPPPPADVGLLLLPQAVTAKAAPASATPRTILVRNMPSPRDAIGSGQTWPPGRWRWAGAARSPAADAPGAHERRPARGSGRRDAGRAWC